MKIYQRPPMDRSVELLVDCRLPYSDLTESSFEYFLGCGDEANPKGIIGLELRGEDALLRSLAISADARGKGCGEELVAKLEDLARSKCIRNLYLLTDTAEKYFERLGFEKVERHLVSNAIRETEEFSTLCSEDAVVMRKAL